jgi:hypothetical protein
MQNDNLNLIEFLRDIASSLENEKVNEEQMKIIGEFYMLYKFYENKDDISQNELNKFLALGYYIYTKIEQKLSNDNNTNKIL